MTLVKLYSPPFYPPPPSPPPPLSPSFSLFFSTFQTADPSYVYHVNQPTPFDYLASSQSAPWSSLTHTETTTEQFNFKKSPFLPSSLSSSTGSASMPALNLFSSNSPHQHLSHNFPTPENSHDMPHSFSVDNVSSFPYSGSHFPGNSSSSSSSSSVQQSLFSTEKLSDLPEDLRQVAEDLAGSLSQQLVDTVSHHNLSSYPMQHDFDRDSLMANTTVLSRTQPHASAADSYRGSTNCSIDTHQLSDSIGGAMNLSSIVSLASSFSNGTSQDFNTYTSYPAVSTMSPTLSQLFAHYTSMKSLA